MNEFLFLFQVRVLALGLIGEIGVIVPQNALQESRNEQGQEQERILVDLHLVMENKMNRKHAMEVFLKHNEIN